MHQTHNTHPLKHLNEVKEQERARDANVAIGNSVYGAWKGKRTKAEVRQAHVTE